MRGLVGERKGLMNILVTGGAGYIGSHTVQAFRNTRHKVVVFDNFSTGNSFAVDDDTQLIEGDIRDFELLKHIMGQHEIDAVMHFAANSLVGESMQEPAKYYNNNVFGTLTLLNAMKAVGVDKMVFSSTAAVYGEPEVVPIAEDMTTNPTNTYGRTKLAIEWALADYARAYDIQYVALRYFNAAGASLDASIGEAHPLETHLVPLILQAVMAGRAVKVFGDDYPTIDGTCIRDYIHVLDLAQAHVLALDYLIDKEQSNVFNLGVQNGLSVLEIIKAVEGVTGCQVQYDVVERRAGDPAKLVAGADKAAALLGFKPQYSDVDTIIQTAWAWEQRYQQLKTARK